MINHTQTQTQAPTQPIIQPLRIRNLNLSLGELKICNQLDLDIQAGQSWGLLGANGIGKTTLLHTLAGLNAPQSGSIQLYGEDLTKLSRRHIARQLGLLAQQSEDAFPGNVFETALGARYPQLAWYQTESSIDRQRVHQALANVELEGFEHRQVSSLSGGERQRLAIACLQIQAPKIALLDEPSNHLDLRHQISLLKQIKEQFTMANAATIMVLHDLNLCARYCDHVLMLFGNGEWLAGKAFDYLKEEHLGRLYQYPIRKLSEDGLSSFVPENISSNAENHEEIKGD